MPNDMSKSVYKFIEPAGTGSECWEKAATAAVEMAAKTRRDLRAAEVTELDLHLKDGKVEAYRAKYPASEIKRSKDKGTRV